MTTYIFHRGDIWYPIELKNDDDAVANAIINKGTTKVTNTHTNKVVWSCLGEAKEKKLNSTPNDERSDATDDDSSTGDDKQITQTGYRAHIK